MLETAHGRLRKRGPEPRKPPLIALHNTATWRAAWVRWLNWELDRQNEKALLAPFGEAFRAPYHGERRPLPPAQKRGRGRPPKRIGGLSGVQMAALDLERIRHILWAEGERRYYKCRHRTTLFPEDIAAARWGVDAAAVLDHARQNDRKRPELRYLPPEVRVWRSTRGTLI